MSHDPVEHTSNSTVTTCADGTTEHTENGGLGVNICCSSALALYQTGNNDGKRWNFPVVEADFYFKLLQNDPEADTIWSNIE